MYGMNKQLHYKGNKIKNSASPDVNNKIEEKDIHARSVQLDENGEDVVSSDQENNFSSKYNENNNLNDYDLIENNFNELLDYNRNIIASIEKRQDLITKVQSSYNVLRNHLSYHKSRNLELEKKIENLKNEMEFLHNDFENYKLEKEKETNNLYEEIEKMQAEKENDKKVLDEFQNMIKVLEKIKGIFKKD